MKDYKEKELDAFVKQLIQEMALEEPSADFSRSVLLKIEKASQNAPSIRYTPLISRTAWYFLILLTILLIMLAAFGNIEFDLFLKNRDFLGYLTERTFFLNVPKIAFSNVVVYASLALGFFVYLQIYILKKSWMQKEVLY